MVGGHEFEAVSGGHVEVVEWGEGLVEEMDQVTWNGDLQVSD